MYAKELFGVLRRLPALYGKWQLPKVKKLMTQIFRQCRSSFVDLLRGIRLGHIPHSAFAAYFLNRFVPADTRSLLYSSSFEVLVKMA